MNELQKRTAKPYRLSRNGNTGFEFDPTATEVAILDRAGHVIWHQRQDEAPAPIHWTGIDTMGQTVETGDYICKIVYPDEKVAYLPFVFVKKN